jgi:hypothetical protein
MLVEIPGRDAPMWTGDVDVVADEIRVFLTGDRDTIGSSVGATTRRDSRAATIATTVTVTVTFKKHAGAIPR